MKKCSDEDRIHEVEHSLFTPLIFSATGGMAHEASTFYKHLASSYLRNGQINMLLVWAGLIVASIFIIT